jgi:hypothetical protein
VSFVKLRSWPFPPIALRLKCWRAVTQELK